MAHTGTLHIDHLSKQYVVQGDTLPVLDNITLTVNPGEFVSIVGSSGCGKSTLLRLIVGLEDDYQGEVVLDGQRVVGTSLSRGIVFQEHRLFPWLTVEENIALGLLNAAIPADEKARSVREHIGLVGLAGFETAYPHQLSGGMSQRVAIARALVSRPDVLLLDEPFGALDALTRAHLQDELLKIVARTQSTVVMVTHDVDEAVLLSDRIVMMTNGPAATIGEILAVALARPRNRVELAEDPTYVHLRKEVIDFLYTRHAHHEALAA